MTYNHYRDLMKAEFTYSTRRDRILAIYEAYFLKCYIKLEMARLIENDADRAAAINKVPNLCDVWGSKCNLVSKKQGVELLSDEKELESLRRWLRIANMRLTDMYDNLSKLLNNNFLIRHKGRWVGPRHTNKRTKGIINYISTSWSDYEARKITTIKENKYLNYLSWQNHLLFESRMRSLSNEYREAWFRRYRSFKARGIIIE